MLCMGRMDFISKARVVGRGIRDGWRPPVCGNQTIIEMGAMDRLGKEVDKEMNKEVGKEVDKEVNKEMNKEVEKKMEKEVGIWAMRWTGRWKKG